MNKHIYITSLHLSHGGIEMAIALMSNAFVKKGYDVTILCVYNLGEPAYKFSEKVKIKYLTDVRPNKEEFKAFRSALSERYKLPNSFLESEILRFPTKNLMNKVIY